jgi:hypothetical protein
VGPGDHGARPGGLERPGTPASARVVPLAGQVRSRRVLPEPRYSGVRGQQEQRPLAPGDRGARPLRCHVNGISARPHRVCVIVSSPGAPNAPPSEAASFEPNGGLTLNTGSSNTNRRAAGAFGAFAGCAGRGRCARSAGPARCARSWKAGQITRSRAVRRQSATTALTHLEPSGAARRTRAGAVRRQDADHARPHPGGEVPRL